MKRARILFLAVLWALPALAPAGAHATSPAATAAVAAAAAAGLPVFLAEVPDGDLPLLGFADRAETARAAAGAPFAIHTAAPRALLGLGAADRLGSLLEETGLWYVPVLVDGEPRALLTVSLAGDAAEAVGLSAAGLAREIGAFERWRAGAGDVAEARFVRIRQAASDFMVLETAAGERLRPFASAQAALGLAGDGLIEPAAAAPALKAAVRRGLE